MRKGENGTKVTGREARENPKILKSPKPPADPAKGKADAIAGVNAAGQR